VAKVPQIKRKGHLSPEARQKLSELAKERHRTGVWKPPSQEDRAKGLQSPKRRNKKKRASEYVAEAAQLQAAEIVAVFKDATDKSQPMGIRLKAAQAWLEVEQGEFKMTMQEEAASAQQHSRDELIAILAEKLTAGPASQILRRQLEHETGVVDAVVVSEDDDGDASKAA
jgi:hypothetical protein